jgi:hypothetical protein
MCTPTVYTIVHLQMPLNIQMLVMKMKNLNEPWIFEKLHKLNYSFLNQITSIAISYSHPLSSQWMNIPQNAR